MGFPGTTVKTPSVPRFPGTSVQTGRLPCRFASPSSIHLHARPHARTVVFQSWPLAVCSEARKLMPPGRLCLKIALANQGLLWLHAQLRNFFYFCKRNHWVLINTTLNLQMPSSVRTFQLYKSSSPRTWMSFHSFMSLTSFMDFHRFQCGPFNRVGKTAHT